MMLQEREIEHVARLARLKLDDGERVRLARDLSLILDYVAKLGELDLDRVSATSHVAELATPLRPDLSEPSPAADAALDAAPARVGRLISVPRVIG
jgi:aspartyl-tRNA(Asn)/glutamyl-tRNA(Gln) amidotransferase subunit C